MAKEVARFQLTSGNNNLERWLIDDDANLIFDNADSTKYVNISSRNYYSSAFFNFPSSIYGYLFSSGFLLCDKATKVYKQRSTDGGTTWSDYSQTNAMVSTYGTLYTMPSHDTNVGGTYVINLICNDAQCISSIAPLFTVASEYNTYISSIYVSPYTWSPVNKINGKMGNVNLSQIIYLNDGEPVTGADSEDVTFVDESGLDVLIEKAVWVDDAVTVEYYIPNDTFEYVKLVYKYGDVPADINDGTAIDLDPNKTSLVITDIENPDNYWFIIFTDKSCSLGYELIINQDTALYNLLSGMF